MVLTERQEIDEYMTSMDDLPDGDEDFQFEISDKPIEILEGVELEAFIAEVKELEKEIEEELAEELRETRQAVPLNNSHQYQ